MFLKSGFASSHFGAALIKWVTGQRMSATRREIALSRSPSASTVGRYGRVAESECERIKVRKDQLKLAWTTQA